MYFNTRCMWAQLKQRAQKAEVERAWANCELNQTHESNCVLRIVIQTELIIYIDTFIIWFLRYFPYVLSTSVIRIKQNF